MLYFTLGLNTWLTLVPYYGTAATLWAIMLSTYGIKTSQQITTPKALLATLASIAAGNILVIILIR